MVGVPIGLGGLVDGSLSEADDVEGSKQPRPAGMLADGLLVAGVMSIDTSRIECLRSPNWAKNAWRHARCDAASTRSRPRHRLGRPMRQSGQRSSRSSIPPRCLRRRGRSRHRPNRWRRSPRPPTRPNRSASGGFPAGGRWLRAGITQRHIKPLAAITKRSLKSETRACCHAIRRGNASAPSPGLR